MGEGEGGMFQENSMYIIYSETDHQPMEFSRQEYWTVLQGSNPCLLHCRQIFYRLRQQGSPQNTDIPCFIVLCCIVLRRYCVFSLTNWRFLTTLHQASLLAPFSTRVTFVCVCALRKSIHLSLNLLWTITIINLKPKVFLSFF